MIRHFIILIAVAFLTACGSRAEAQCSRNCKGCKEKATNSNLKTETMNNGSKSLSCKLTSPELRKRKEEVIAVLKKQVIEKKELPDGYSYKFTGTDDMLDSITAFIKSERLCCDFFNFRVAVNNDSFIWLDITGEDGAKEFIITELEM